jgi:two-component system, LytTR family, response regulator
MIYSQVNTIAINCIRGRMMLETKSIIRIEAVSNYSTIHLADGRSITISKVLKHFETLLDSHGFARIHRSHLVNSRWIQRYLAGTGEIHLKNNETINASRRKKGEVMNALIKSVSLNQAVTNDFEK